MLRPLCAALILCAALTLHAAQSGTTANDDLLLGTWQLNVAVSGGGCTGTWSAAYVSP